MVKVFDSIDLGTNTQIRLEIETFDNFGIFQKGEGDKWFGLNLKVYPRTDGDHSTIISLCGITHEGISALIDSLLEAKQYLSSQGLEKGKTYAKFVKE